MAKRDPMTPWGVKVSAWCLKTGVSKKELAEIAGVKYDTLLQVGKGRRAGHEAIPAVETAMANYKRPRRAVAR